MSWTLFFVSQILTVTDFCHLFLPNISCSIYSPIIPLLEPLFFLSSNIFPYFSYYRSFLLLIIHPTSSLSSCQFITLIPDKLVVKHSFSLVISPLEDFSDSHSLPDEVQMAYSESVRPWPLSCNLSSNCSLHWLCTLAKLCPKMPWTFLILCFCLNPSYWPGMHSFLSASLSPIHHSHHNASPFSVKTSKFSPAQLIIYFCFTRVFPASFI